MPPVFIALDRWSPGDSYFGEGWSTVKNLYPFFDGWRPWREFVPSASSVASSGPLTGGYVHIWASGIGTGSYLPDAATLFAGSEFFLYSLDPTTGAFTDISRAAGPPAYGAGAIEPAGWRFCSIGNDIWATNWNEALQRRTNNAGNFANGVVSTFTPQPRFIAPIREHLCGLNLSNAGRFQDEFVWSDADDATNFDPPTGTSTSIAGSKRLTSIPGQCTGLIGGQYGLAFKRRAIYYLEYTSTTQVFRPDVLSSHIGTAQPSSIISSRHGIFFLGPDGFYRIMGLSPPEKISDLAVDEFLINSAFSTLTTLSQQAAFEDARLIGFQLPNSPLIGWLFRRSHILNGNNEGLIYNPVTGVWSYIVPETGVATQLPTAMIERPYGTTVYDVLAALTWDGSVSRYAPLAETAADNTLAPTLQLRFRPSGFDVSSHQQQSILEWVLPVFSKTAVAATVLTESVTAESLLDPIEDVWKTEGPRLASERDAISGVFPFQLPGKFFRITINCAAEDFANFEGVWISTRPLA